jgi:hypothetical protein
MTGTALKVADTLTGEKSQGDAAGLLGGASLLKRKVRSRLDVHEVSAGFRVARLTSCSRASRCWSPRRCARRWA